MVVVRCLCLLPPFSRLFHLFCFMLLLHAIAGEAFERRSTTARNFDLFSISFSACPPRSSWLSSARSSALTMSCSGRGTGNFSVDCKARFLQSNNDVLARIHWSPARESSKDGERETSFVEGSRGRERFSSEHPALPRSSTCAGGWSDACAATEGGRRAVCTCASRFPRRQDPSWRSWREGSVRSRLRSPSRARGRRTRTPASEPGGGSRLRSLLELSTSRASCAREDCGARCIPLPAHFAPSRKTQRCHCRRLRAYSPTCLSRPSGASAELLGGSSFSSSGRRDLRAVPSSAPASFAASPSCFWSGRPSPLPSASCSWVSYSTCGRSLHSDSRLAPAPSILSPLVSPPRASALAILHATAAWQSSALKTCDIFGEPQVRRRSLYEVAERFDELAKHEYDGVLKQVAEEANREMRSNCLGRVPRKPEALEYGLPSTGGGQTDAAAAILKPGGHDGRLERRDTKDEPAESSCHGRPASLSSRVLSGTQADAQPGARRNTEPVSAAREAFAARAPRSAPVSRRPLLSSPRAPVFPASPLLPFGPASVLPAPSSSEGSTAQDDSRGDAGRKSAGMNGKAQTAGGEEERLEQSLEAARSAAALLSAVDASIASFPLRAIARIFIRVCQLTSVRGEDLKDDPRYARLLAALDLRLQEDVQAVASQIALFDRKREEDRVDQEAQRDTGTRAREPLSLAGNGDRETEAAGDGDAAASEGPVQGETVCRISLCFELLPEDLVALAKALRLSRLALDLDMVLRNVEILALLQLPSFSLQQICELVMSLGAVRTTGLRPLSRTFLSRAASRLGVLLSACLDEYEALPMQQDGGHEGRRDKVARSEAPEARQKTEGETKENGRAERCDEGKRRQERGHRLGAGAAEATESESRQTESRKVNRRNENLFREASSLSSSMASPAGTRSVACIEKDPLRFTQARSLSSAVENVLGTLPSFLQYEEESRVCAQDLKRPAFLCETFLRSLGRAWAQTMSLEERREIRGAAGASETPQGPQHLLLSGSPCSTLSERQQCGERDGIKSEGARSGRGAGTEDREGGGCGVPGDGNRHGETREVVDFLEKATHIRYIAKALAGTLKAGSADDERVLSPLTRAAFGLLRDCGGEGTSHCSHGARGRSGEACAHDHLKRCRISVAQALLETLATFSELLWGDASLPAVTIKKRLEEDWLRCFRVKLHVFVSFVLCPILPLQAGAFSKELWSAALPTLRSVLPFLSLSYLDQALRLYGRARVTGTIQPRRLQGGGEDTFGAPDVLTGEGGGHATYRQEANRGTQDGGGAGRDKEFLECLLRVLMAHPRNMTNGELSAFADRLVSNAFWLGGVESGVAEELVATVFAEIRERYIDGDADAQARVDLPLQPAMNLALLAGEWGVISMQALFDFLVLSLHAHRAELHFADLLKLSEALRRLSAGYDLLHALGAEALLDCILHRAEEIYENLRKRASSIPDDLYTELQEANVKEHIRGNMKVSLVEGLSPYLRSLATLEEEISVMLSRP
ncbi:hypothetical protein BESB_070900 [Besnoitia besnoiti]|uniref:Transmembrane protein n=1 Tax=Besnoitia besnoiti TaxID=94643 RepID=A0A2A9M637_BESBE|nr:uncharacterized protein BESB_070900 [Besnoitia besnoiti]PFH33938.1 hypothetical protein BESB_070900 [Besnoitia besnoiti]